MNKPSQLRTFVQSLGQPDIVQRNKMYILKKSIKPDVEKEKNFKLIKRIMGEFKSHRNTSLTAYNGEAI